MDRITITIQDLSIKANLENRLWKYIDKKSFNECWNWVGKSKHPNGYGQISAGRKNRFKAHRVMWILINGDIPKGYYICHKCDNPSCCNPNHLFLGTPKDNMIDRDNKGRGIKPPNFYGSKHHNTKFNESDAIKILNDNRKYSEIAKDYNVCEMTIRRLKNRISWKNLDECNRSCS